MEQVVPRTILVDKMDNDSNLTISCIPYQNVNNIFPYLCPFFYTEKWAKTHSSRTSTASELFPELLNQFPLNNSKNPKYHIDNDQVNKLNLSSHMKNPMRR